MSSMENASTAKLAIMNTPLSKEERIELSNQNMKTLVQSVKGIIRNQKQAEIDDPDIAGSSKILVHPDLKELTIALLVKFGSAMIYANKQARNASRKNSSSREDPIIHEYKKRIDQLQQQVEDLEDKTDANEEVRQLLYTQDPRQLSVQEASRREALATSELGAVYKSFNVTKQNRLRMEKEIQTRKINEKRLSRENSDLRLELDALHEPMPTHDSVENFLANTTTPSMSQSPKKDMFGEKTKPRSRSRQHW